MMRRYSTLIMILAPFVVLNFITIFFWSDIPREIPLSWDAQGKPEGWGSRNHLWLIPGYYLVTAVALRVLTLCFPASCNASNTLALHCLLGGVAMFFLMHHIKNLLFAWSLTTKTHQGFEFLAINCLMTFLGASWRVSTPNPVLGIPTPWARASADNWQKTHKIAGHTCMTAAGLLQITLLFRYPILPAFLLISIILGSIIYSYQLHKGSGDALAS